jgi:pimeloyl-ACP methyl ester carboxylesterase
MLRRLAFVPLLFTSCTYLIPRPIENVPVTHIAMFDGAGALVDPSHNVEPDKHWLFRHYPPQKHAASARKAILDDMIANAPVVNGKRQLLLYIHGGMKFQVASVVNAKELNETMVRLKAPVYPIFINWQSSFFSTYWDHIAHIRQGQYWTGKATIALAPLWVISDVVRAVGHVPLDVFYEVKSIYDGVKLAPFYDKIKEESLEGDKPLMHHGEDMRSTSRKAVGFAVETVTLPLKFVTAPLVDGFGSGAWDAMQHRTTALFQSDEEFDKPLPLVRDAEGGLSLFLRELEERIRKDGHPWSITLVGHSMGAIVVNQIVLRHPNLPIDRIVYLSAACSMEDYRTTVVPYLEQHPHVTMHHLILERHAEAREWNAYDIVPRGTLLIWIDNLLSKPASVLERRTGRYTNLMRDIHSTPPSIIDRVTVLTFDGGPQLVKTQPQSHTDASMVQFWREECLVRQPLAAYPNDCMQP